MMPASTTFPHIDLACYDVNVRITGSSALIEEVFGEICSIIPGVSRFVGDGDLTATFELTRSPEGVTTAKINGEEIISHPEPGNFYHVFTTFVRLAIAENSPELLFMHAGAVGWKGTGIIIPGDSFVGKSTLVTELVKLGATYYSDDYAVLDKEGFLHSFPRDISMRKDDGKYTRFRMKPADLGGVIADTAVPVGAVWMTRYERSGIWEPVKLTPGQGLLEMLPYTFGFADRPNFSLPILNKVVADAIIISSKRGPAEIFAETFLEFVDKTVY